MAPRSQEPQGFKVTQMSSKSKTAKKEELTKYKYFCTFKLNVKGDKYEFVGGKTNYTSPDLDFSKDYGNSLTSFARKFLSDKDLNWDDTIIIIEHIPTNNKESDNEMALFIECFLQREFNLFDC